MNCPISANRDRRHVAGQDGGGHRPAKAGREVVDHRDGPAGVKQREHDVAADVARATSDEYVTLLVRTVL